MNVRTCKGKTLNTGASACPYDRDKVVGAIVVPHGVKLANNLTGSALEEMCHAAEGERAFPILTFVEYSKNGGEPQVSAVGYGPNKVTDVNAMTDTFTLDEYNEVLAQSLSRSMNKEFDVYFFDKNNMVYGYDDGTDQLAGFHMSSIYPTVTPYPTSGAKATLLVNFCYKDARLALENANYTEMGFNIPSFAYGLTPVKFVSEGENKYRIVEAIGGYDRTAEFGSVIAATPTAALKGSVSGVTYSEETNLLTIADVTPVLKAPADLYTAHIKGIVQA